VDKVPNTPCRVTFLMLTVTHLESEVHL